jgi:hypothetical protein
MGTSAGLIVAIVIAAGQGQAPGTAALLAALTEALGPGASIVVQTSVAVPSDADLLRVEELVHAAAVAVVVPGGGVAAGAAAPVVHLRVHLLGGATHPGRAGTPGRTPPRGRWISRQLVFVPGDAAVERGRTVGLAVASMVLAGAGAVSGPSPSVNPTPPNDPGEGSGLLGGAGSGPRSRPGHEGLGRPSPPGSSETAPASSAPAAAGVAVSTTSAPGAASGWWGGMRGAFELGAVGATGVGGAADGLGGAAHLEVGRRITGDPTLADHLWARVGGGARGGSVPGLDGGDLVVWATLGGAWRLPGWGNRGSAAEPDGPTSPGLRSFGLGVTFDVGAVIHELFHRQTQGAAFHDARVLPAASVGVEGTWRLGPSWQAVVGLGAELAFGRTDVLVARQQVATIPALRGLGTLGLRFGAP